MPEALKETFKQSILDKLPRDVKISSKYFTATTEWYKTESTLVQNGVNANLAKFYSGKITVSGDIYLRSSGIRVQRLTAKTYTSAVCLYRKNDKKVDLFCMNANLELSADKDESDIVLSLLFAMKKESEKVPTELAKFHVFTSLGMVAKAAKSNLKSAQTQKELDDILKTTINGKDAAMIDLNQNKNDPFVAKLFRNGLDSFRSTTVIESLEGVEASMLMEYANFLADQLKIPGNARGDFLTQLEISAYTDKNEWKEFDFLFKLNSGTAKYVSVMSVTDPASGNLDFLVSDIKSGFELGPDVIISTHTKSKFFGLFSSTKIVITKRPAELTQKSIELLFKFFKVVAFEKFAQFRKIK